MDPLTLTTVCILCAAQPPPVPVEVTRWKPIIGEASARFAVPETWIEHVMRSESGGQTMLAGEPITSVAGAMGLMQLMPKTYADLRDRYGLGIDPYEPRDNILAGTAYLRQMYERYGYPLLFAAYHAGPKRVDGLLFRGKSLPQATQKYVRGIVPDAESFLQDGSEFEASRTSENNSPIQPGNRGHKSALFFDIETASFPTPSYVTKDDSTHNREALPTSSKSSSLFVSLSTTSP